VAGDNDDLILPVVPAAAINPPIGLRDSSRGKVLVRAPDIKNTPVGATPVPVAYQTWGPFPLKDNYSPNVLYNSQQAVKKVSQITKTFGGEPGTLGGVASGSYNGPAWPMTWSSMVLVNSANAERKGDLFGHNGPPGKPNTISVAQFPGSEATKEPPTLTEPKQQKTFTEGAVSGATETAKDTAEGFYAWSKKAASHTWHYYRGDAADPVAFAKEGEELMAPVESGAKFAVGGITLGGAIVQKVATGKDPDLTEEDKDNIRYFGNSVKQSAQNAKDNYNKDFDEGGADYATGRLLGSVGTQLVIAKGVGELGGAAVKGGATVVKGAAKDIKDFATKTKVPGKPTAVRVEPPPERNKKASPCKRRC
jgi:hypothetical protein